MYISIYVCVCVYIYIYAHACMHARTHARAQAHTHPYPPTHTDEPTHPTSGLRVTEYARALLHNVSFGMMGVAVSLDGAAAADLSACSLTGKFCKC